MQKYKFLFLITNIEIKSEGCKIRSFEMLVRKMLIARKRENWSLLHDRHYFITIKKNKDPKNLSN